MTLERIDPRALERTKGPAWDGLRRQFLEISETLLSLSPQVSTEFTTIYLKFLTTNAIDRKILAVVWLKKGTELVVGLAVPPSFEARCFIKAPPGCKYAGLNGYIKIKPGEEVPAELRVWAAEALKFSTATTSEQG